MLPLFDFEINNALGARLGARYCLDMRPPAIDQFRAPFVEPLGHLVVNAAQADMALVEFCALIEPGTEDAVQERRAFSLAASRLRNNDRKADAYLRGRVEAIRGEHWKATASEVLDRWKAARDRRNRAIHDAVVVGALGDAEAGYTALTLHLKYDVNGERHLTEITPASIMSLAHEFHVIRLDLQLLISVVQSDEYLASARCLGAR